MKRFRLPLLVFLLVFLSGTGFVLLLNRPQKPKPAPDLPRRTERVRHHLPPLNLPDEKPLETGRDTWEFTGTTPSNFVTARARFCAELMHQGWREEKQIALDESISPRTLLTFSRGEYELVLMLWKIDTGSTGFAYKREKIIKPGVTISE